MPNTASGLEQPTADEQVNSEAGFAKALEGRGVEPDATPATDTSVLSGLETVEPEQDRGPDGRFVAKQTPDTPESESDTSTGAEAVTSDDPAVAALLAKYNGDVSQALKAATEAQSLIGRRDQEKDELRERLARVEGMLEARATQPAAPTLSDEQVEETAANLIQQGGYAAAAEQAANASLQGDARVYDSILEQWALESPIQAQRFDLDFQFWKRDQDAPKVAADPWVESQKATTGITATMSALRNEIGKEAFETLVTQDADGESPMTRALGSLPPQVAQMIESDDPEIRLAGTRIVADRATLSSGAVTAASNVQKDDGALPPSVVRKLAGSSVATAGLRPVSAAPEGHQSVEDVIKAFKSDIMAAETTSVASGLTYGNSPVR